MTITPDELKGDGPGTIVSKLNGPGGGVTFGDPVDIGTTNQSGVSTSAPRADHVHAHGDQPGGDLHADAVSGGADGFMTGADKAKLDLVAPGATNTPLSTADPQDLGTTAPGSGTSASKDDHVHAHGDLAGGSLHSLVIAGGAAGFMDGADKTKLDSYAVVGADGTILQASGGTTTFVTVSSILGGQGFVAPIDTLVNLAALPAAPLPDGSEIYVNEVEDIYVLEKATAHTPDGVTVIAATGGGYWVARHQGRWDDMQGSIAQGGGASALTVEAFRDTAFLMWFMRHDQDDALNFIYQFSHRWDYVKPVVPHLHIVPMADPVAPQVARFNGYFVWTRPNYAAQPLPALVGWTTFGPIDVTINPGDVHVQKIVSLGAVTPPAWARESSSLLLWFRRNGTDPGDTYTTAKPGAGTPAANIGLISADVHFRANKMGTEAELPT